MEKMKNMKIIRPEKDFKREKVGILENNSITLI